jgi:hypothetical protein
VGCYQRLPLCLPRPCAWFSLDTQEGCLQEGCLQEGCLQEGCLQEGCLQDGYACCAAV